MRRCWRCRLAAFLVVLGNVPLRVRRFYVAWRLERQVLHILRNAHHLPPTALTRRTAKHMARAIDGATRREAQALTAALLSPTR